MFVNKCCYQMGACSRPSTGINQAVPPTNPMPSCVCTHAAAALLLYASPLAKAVQEVLTISVCFTRDRGGCSHISAHTYLLTHTCMPHPPHRQWRWCSLHTPPRLTGAPCSTSTSASRPCCSRTTGVCVCVCVCVCASSLSSELQGV